MDYSLDSDLLALLRQEQFLIIFLDDSILIIKHSVAIIRVRYLPGLLIDAYHITHRNVPIESKKSVITSFSNYHFLRDDLKTRRFHMESIMETFKKYLIEHCSYKTIIPEYVAERLYHKVEYAYVPNCNMDNVAIRFRSTTPSLYVDYYLNTLIGLIKEAFERGEIQHKRFDEYSLNDIFNSFIAQHLDINDLSLYYLIYSGNCKGYYHFIQYIDLSASLGDAPFSEQSELLLNTFKFELDRYTYRFKPP